MGMGPGNMHYKTDPRDRSLAVQLKMDGRIDNLVQAMFTCDQGLPHLKYGGWDTHDANIKGDMIR